MICCMVIPQVMWFVSFKLLVLKLKFNAFWIIYHCTELVFAFEFPIQVKHIVIRDASIGNKGASIGDKGCLYRW